MECIYVFVYLLWYVFMYLLWYVFIIVSKLPKTTTAYRKSKFLPVHVVLSLMIAIVASNVILFYRELLTVRVEGVLQQLC